MQDLQLNLEGKMYKQITTQRINLEVPFEGEISSTGSSIQQGFYEKELTNIIYLHESGIEEILIEAA